MVQGAVLRLILILQVVFLVLLLVALGVIIWRSRGQTSSREQISASGRTWLDYGNFFIVALGLVLAIIGFLVVLAFLGRFNDGTQALGFLTALFGAITGLVGTYFGVRSSSEARAGAERLAHAAGGTPTPTITIAPPDANPGVSTTHTVTATVTSVDGSPAADVPVTFTVTAGPDMDTPPQTIRTDAFGRAPFTFTNNGTAGTDAIEAAALGGKGTTKVTFE